MKYIINERSNQKNLLIKQEVQIEEKRDTPQTTPLMGCSQSGVRITLNKICGLGIWVRALMLRKRKFFGRSYGS
jgi:hypothetical protein